MGVGISPITKEEINQYCSAVGEHWVWLTVFILFALLGIIQNIIQSFWEAFVMPSWVWFGVAFLAFFVAQFLAWRDMRNARDKEREEKDRIKKYDVTQQTLSDLAKFRDRLISHQNAPVNSGTELGQWIEQFKGIREEVKAILRDTVSYAEFRLYDHIGLFQVYDMVKLENLTDEEHKNYVHWRSQVSRDHKWLTSLIIDYSRQKYRPEPNELSPIDAAPTDTSQGK